MSGFGGGSYAKPGDARGSIHSHGSYRDGAYTDRSYGSLSEEEKGRALKPLIRQIERWDRRRIRLEQAGGDLADLEKMALILHQPFRIRTRYGTSECRLSDPGGVRRDLLDLDPDLHLEVKQTATRMPVYYLCRRQRDFWSQYSLVVEDYYLSPGYPLQDERFVKLMSGGHENCYLRLSPFRQPLRELLSATDSATARDPDRVLRQVGKHVFQAAWHDDQRFAFAVADQFGLHAFRQAIELLYLCLGSELCELRGGVREDVLIFFRHIYPQPVLHAFLQGLGHLDGGGLNAVARCAGDFYGVLLRAFGHFLGIELWWPPGSAALPLFKLMTANYGRLRALGSLLQENEALAEAIGYIEGVADNVSRSILGMVEKDGGRHDPSKQEPKQNPTAASAECPSC